ncbi:YeeE/YedE family protein [Defluviimonas sp. WL0050]|jgi:uncharacterized membrane protein YedE/YeeE|uniref:YeeE/YedE family protein n=1 Tax=Albidovulum litorale TaxID=2984134 RepID=A0ABT2ZNS3_9RHOB|nr:YeeE/YedE family protein [Defluviimonas sp. WL0050]MCV2872790.1 YeeE/YedE family protein [Defluviimonas sp. WL0050]
MYQDWIWGLVGGGLIGIAAALYLLVNGRILGASGILGGLVDGTERAHSKERLAFLAGLVLVPVSVVPFYSSVDTHLTPNLAVVIFAGLLVGVGTRLANGCTSGHGVCGISRLAPRGMVATVFYLLGGGASLLLFKHVLGVI